MITPVTTTVAAVDEFASRIDAELAAATALRDQALALVKDNTWCVTALARRGIEVPA